MKKFFIFFIVILCRFFFTSPSYAQIEVRSNAYYDALILYDILNSESSRFENPAFIDAIKRRKVTLTKPLKEDTLAILRTLYLNVPSRPHSALVAGISIPSAFQSMVIDAVAKVVAEEFKEGVTEMYINRFRQRLDSLPELKAVMPRTNDFLQKSNPFNYAMLGKEFKEVFEEDLKNVLANVVIFLNETTHEPYNTFRANSRLYFPLVLSIDMADKLQNGFHPAQLLEYLDWRYKESTAFQSYHRVIHIVNLLQRNLQDLDRNPVTANFTGGNQYQNIWLSVDKLKKLDNPRKIELFFSVIQGQDSTFLSSFGIIGKDVGKFFQENILPIISKMNGIDNLLSKPQVLPDDFTQVMQFSFDVVQIANSRFSKPLLENDVIEVSQKVIDVQKTILKKDYTAVFPNLIYLFEKFASSGTLSPQIIRFKNAVLKYGPFVTGVINAKNSEELKEVIKKSITPSGNYIVKRNSLSSLSLVAHPGVVVGYERLPITNPASQNKWNWQPNIGLTSPIGFEMVWGTRKKRESIRFRNFHKFVTRKGHVKTLTGSYFGFMVSFADLGAVVNYRLNDSQSELPEEITFEQVFSPGFSFHYGFRNTPLTLSVGAQYTPELRKVTVEGTEKELNSVRIQARLTWDVPLINIFTKTDKK